MDNYDELYALLSEHNIADLMVDIESDLLLGEASFLLDGVMRKKELEHTHTVVKNNCIDTDHPRNPILLRDTLKVK